MQTACAFETPSGPDRRRGRELRRDRVLVGQRPDLGDLAVAECVEHVLGETHPPSVYRQAEEYAARRAVEGETAGDLRRVGQQQRDVEPEIGDFMEVVFQHRLVA